MARIQQKTLDFLSELALNNDRDWFQDNKARYEAARDNVGDFAQELLDRLSEHDVLETQNGKKSLYRIYRDVRFSKNKLPYKNHFAGRFKRDGKLRRGSYYFHVVPDNQPNDFFGNSVVGGGFYGPERDDLKRLREELAADGDTLREIIADKDFVRVFGELRGDQLKTAPKGYPRDHKNIDLLRYKNFYAFRDLSRKQLLSREAPDLFVEALLTLRPFFDYFSEVLTTDANGELIV